MKVVPLEPEALRYVVVNMADVSRAEVFASMPENIPFAVEHLTKSLPLMFAPFTLACDDGMPAAFVAVIPIMGGRAGIVWVRTDRFRELALQSLRWARQFYVAEVFMQFRRVDFTGSAPDTPSGRWLKAVGFTCEGIARAYSEAGEDFGHWAWLHPAWRGGTVDRRGTGLSSQLQ